jgi:hypothetical protein
VCSGWRKIIEIAMDAEKTIAEIELLERIHALPDTRPFSAADREAANRMHDERHGANPRFRVWQQSDCPAK